MSIETLTVKGVPVRFDFQRPITQPQQAVAVSTLQLLPADHLRRLPTIVVGDRPMRGGGGAVAPGQPGGPLIRINVQRFGDSLNAERNLTLLHEIGHIMDYSYNCIDVFYRLRENRPHLNLMRRLAQQGLYQGATQGEREIYADAYSGLFRRARNLFMGRLPWTGAQELYVAVICSPPFDCCRAELASFVGVSWVDMEEMVVAGEPRRRR